MTMETSLHGMTMKTNISKGVHVPPDKLTLKELCTYHNQLDSWPSSSVYLMYIDFVPIYLSICAIHA